MACAISKCCVCLFDFVADQKDFPPVLTCSHEVCVQCIDKSVWSEPWTKQTFVCPLCWELTILPTPSNNASKLEENSSSCISSTSTFEKVKKSSIVSKATACEKPIASTCGSEKFVIEDSKSIVPSPLKDMPVCRTDSGNHHTNCVNQSDNNLFMPSNPLTQFGVESSSSDMALQIASRNLQLKLQKQRSIEKIKFSGLNNNSIVEDHIKKEKPHLGDGLSHEAFDEQINGIKRKLEELHIKPTFSKETKASRTDLKSDIGLNEGMAMIMFRSGRILKKFPPSASLKKFYRGIITSIQSPHRIYIQIIDGGYQRLNHIFEGLQRELSNKSQQELSASSVKYPQQGYPYAVLFDGIWQRAIVIKILENDGIQIQCLDTGRFGLVNHGFNIQSLAESFVHLPAQAVLCELRDIYQLDIKPDFSNLLFSDCPGEAIMDLMKTKENKIVKVTVHNNTTLVDSSCWKEQKFVLVVDMRVETERRSINQQIKDVFLKANRKKEEHPIREVVPINPGMRTKDFHSSMSKAVDEKKYNDNCNTILIPPFTRLDQFTFKTKSSQTNKWDFPEPSATLTPCFKAVLTWVDDKGGIYVHDKKWLAQLNTIRDTLENFNKNVPRSPSDVLRCQPGDACLAKYRGSWFRSVVKELKKEENLVTVFFVDYGSTQDVVCSDVRTDVGLQKIPVGTFRCSLHNLKPLGANSFNEKTPWPKDLVNYLRGAVNQEFNAIVKSYCPLNISLRFPDSSECLTEFMVAALKADYIVQV